MTVRNQRKMAGIPRGVISRLPVYYRYLSGLSQAQEKISSAELGKALSMTAAQIRSDLSYFGSLGLHGYGYRVDQLSRPSPKFWASIGHTSWYLSVQVIWAGRCTTEISAIGGLSSGPSSTTILKSSVRNWQVCKSSQLTTWKITCGQMPVILR